MSTPTRTRISLAEFDAFVNAPDNRECHYERIDGEIHEVVSNGYSSKLAARLVRYLGAFVDDRGLGHVTGADGGYWVGDDRYIPDVAYISFEKQPILRFEKQPILRFEKQPILRFEKQPILHYEEGYIPNPPDLAVEVLSPGNDENAMRVKVANYLLAGTTLWVVNPPEQSAQVFAPGQPARTRYASQQETLDGGAVLPGFTLSLTTLFA